MKAAKAQCNDIIFVKGDILAWWLNHCKPRQVLRSAILIKNCIQGKHKSTYTAVQNTSFSWE